MLSVKAFSGKIIWYFLYSIVSDGSENLIYITIFEEKFDKGELKLRKWDHIRRGELMQDTYWKQFMMSGKIDDYLNYNRVITETGRNKQKDSHMNRISLTAGWAGGEEDEVRQKGIA